jgi:hypothetical protein
MILGYFRDTKGHGGCRGRMAETWRAGTAGTKLDCFRMMIDDWGCPGRSQSTIGKLLDLHRRPQTVKRLSRDFDSLWSIAMNWRRVSLERRRCGKAWRRHPAALKGNVPQNL